MSVRFKTCTNCNNTVPDYIDVDSGCPYCGIYFEGKIKKNSSTGESPGFFSSITRKNISFLVPVFVFPIIIPLILIFSLNVTRSVYFFLSVLSLESGLMGGTALLIYHIRLLVSGDFDWSEFGHPAFFFGSIIWSVFNIVFLFFIVSAAVNAETFVNELLNIGFASLFGGGMISLFAGIILAVPLFIYYEMND